MKSILVIALFYSLGSFAAWSGKVTQKPSTAASFMPENRLYLQDNVKRLSNMTEEQFNQVIDQIVSLYQPIFAHHGAKLNLVRDWEDSTVNAYASQDGNIWSVAMFGGLARRPEVTLDGFALVVCHEIGHHLGGYVFKANRWPSAEGQSDYFATQVCARTIWGFQAGLNRQWKKIRFSDTVKEKCDLVWQDENTRGWCYRTAAASLSLSTLLAALRQDPAPSFETPDLTEVRKTSADHPHGQCRLDTFFAGSLCNKSFDLRIIPGLKVYGGKESLAAELEAAQNSCFKEDGFQIGNRPRCWFRSLRDQDSRLN